MVLARKDAGQSHCPVRISVWTCTVILCTRLSYQFDGLLPDAFCNPSPWRLEVDVASLQPTKKFLWILGKNAKIFILKKFKKQCCTRTARVNGLFCLGWRSDPPSADNASPRSGDGLSLGVITSNAGLWALLWSWWHLDPGAQGRRGCRDRSICGRSRDLVSQLVSQF